MAAIVIQVPGEKTKDTIILYCFHNSFCIFKTNKFNSHLLSTWLNRPSLLISMGVGRVVFAWLAFFPQNIAKGRKPPLPFAGLCGCEENHVQIIYPQKAFYSSSCDHCTAITRAEMYSALGKNCDTLLFHAGTILMHADDRVSSSGMRQSLLLLHIKLTCDKRATQSTPHQLSETEGTTGH